MNRTSTGARIRRLRKSRNVAARPDVQRYSETPIIENAHAKKSGLVKAVKCSETCWRCTSKSELGEALSNAARGIAVTCLSMNVVAADAVELQTATIKSAKKAPRIAAIILRGTMRNLRRTRLQHVGKRHGMLLNK